MELNSSHRLIESLQNPAIYDYDVTTVELLQTHISWVLLTGLYAYKIKKPVDLGFVDFATLEKREFYCREELRLNRRLAPELYLDVVSISGSPELPVIDGSGKPIEFAVKMKQFSQDVLLSHVLERGELKHGHIDGLADQVARFHTSIDKAEANKLFDAPERVREPVKENFRHLFLSKNIESSRPCLERLYEWAEAEFSARKDDFSVRKEQGFVRECHGDMHLGNMILADDSVTIFDCIEFNDSFRWIDVLSEIAFLVMDLEDRSRADYAHRCLNRYLEVTGDYEGLVLLPYYLTYRALVRAKVASIRLSQSDVDATEHELVREQFLGYLKLAEQYTQPTRPMLMITHGLSGSGKTTGTQPVVESLNAIRIRSDVERKRLFGLDGLARTDSRIDDDFYSTGATERTYARLAELANSVVRAGFNVVVDATFLKRWQRDEFKQLSQKLDVPFVILSFQAEEETLRKRISRQERVHADASEATLAVLEQQLDTQEPLESDEQFFVIDCENQQAAEQLIDAVTAKRG